MSVGERIHLLKRVVVCRVVYMVVRMSPAVETGLRGSPDV